MRIIKLTRSTDDDEYEPVWINVDRVDFVSMWEGLTEIRFGSMCIYVKESIKEVLRLMAKV